MDNLYLSALVKEIAPDLLGRSVAKISLANLTLLIDLQLAGGRQLLASFDRANPTFHLSSRTRAESSTETRSSNSFLLLLRKYITNARLEAIWKDPLDRIIEIEFEKLDAGDHRVRTKLVLTLTGRSANAYFIDDQGRPLASLFERDGAEETVLPNRSGEPFDPELAQALSETVTQSEVLDRFFGFGSIFGPQLKSEFLARSANVTPAVAIRSLFTDLFHRKPVPLLYSRLPLDEIEQQVINPKADLLLSHIELVQARRMLRFELASLSQAADQYDSIRIRATALRSKHSALRQLLAREIGRRETAISAIEFDRARFENPERLKRFGDLILANLANARVTGTSVTLVDYYDPDQREIQIEIPEGARLQEAASDYFERYQKARRALEAIASRERDVARNLEPLKQALARLERESTDRCLAEVGDTTEQLLGRIRLRSVKQKPRSGRTDIFGRRFRSSDGYEILVGRNDRENDALTFRVARSTDLWLHAADYPGSHVIVRNPTRAPAPQRTITEAAELAAFYSQAKREGKTAIHYTQKKFVSKPPRSKSGLVRLSSFKTILVEPRCTAERLP